MAPRLPRLNLNRTLAATRRVLGQFKLTDRQKALIGNGALHLLTSAATKSPNETYGAAIRGGLERYVKEHGEELVFPKDLPTKKSIFDLSPEHAQKVTQFTKGAAQLAFHRLKESKQAGALAIHPNPVVREGYHKASAILGNYLNKPLKGASDTISDGIYNAGPVTS